MGLYLIYLRIQRALGLFAAFIARTKVRLGRDPLELKSTEPKNVTSILLSPTAEGQGDFVQVGLSEKWLVRSLGLRGAAYFMLLVDNRQLAEDPEAGRARAST
jgi:hypothetical protein